MNFIVKLTILELDWECLGKNGTISEDNKNLLTKIIKVFFLNNGYTFIEHFIFNIKIGIESKVSNWKFTFITRDRIRKWKVRPSLWCERNFKVNFLIYIRFLNLKDFIFKYSKYLKPLGFHKLNDLCKNQLVLKHRIKLK